MIESVEVPSSTADAVVALGRSDHRRRHESDAQDQLRGDRRPRGVSIYLGAG